MVARKCDLLAAALRWTFNASGECDYFNQKWCEYTGLTFEQSLGSGWVAALHPDDVQNACNVWLNAVTSGTLYENEYRFKRSADATYRWQLARGLPLKNEQGIVVKWFGTCTGIQEQKQMQQERTHLLELEQAARAKAETANRIKDEFLAVLSHELRTPINAILGWSIPKAETILFGKEKNAYSKKSVYCAAKGRRYC